MPWVNTGPVLRGKPEHGRRYRELAESGQYGPRSSWPIGESDAGPGKRDHSNRPTKIMDERLAGLKALMGRKGLVTSTDMMPLCNGCKTTACTLARLALTRGLVQVQGHVRRGSNMARVYALAEAGDGR